MSRRNTGNFISATDQATDSNTANGIFTLTDAAQRTAVGSFPTGRYTPSRSLRFRTSATSYLNRTFGTPTNNNKWTYSTWVKRGTLGANIPLFGNWKTASQATQFYFTTSDQLRFYVGNSAGVTHIDYTTSSLFRDCSAWYHIVLSYDNTLPVTSIGLYVNGNIVPCGATTNIATQNGGYTWNQSALVHYLMAGKDTAGNFFGYFDGHVADTNFIDGQALTPTSFGFTDPETGTWVPKRYSGTYGANGFYLPFTDTSAAGLTDQVPTMSSATAPSGVASASSELNATYLAWKAFDKNGASYWFATATTGWLKYQYATPATITAYSLACDGAGYGPSGWTFEGSNDNSSWTVLDTRSGYGSTLTTTPVYFYCSNSTAYTYYRLNCTGASQAGNLAIDSFAMYNNAGLGKDFSTNTNVWQSTGISTTAGVTYDSMVDVPGIASVSNTTDVGGVQRGNYAVLNSVSVYPLGGNTVVDGNLNATMVVGAGYSASVSSIALPATGKYYCEIKYLSGGLNACFIGVMGDNYTGGGAGAETWGVTWNAAPATYICHGTNTSSADTAITNAAGQTTVMAVDMTAGKMWIGSDRLNVGNAVTWVGGGNPSTGTSPTFTSFGGGGLYSDWPATARNYFFSVTGGYSGGQIVQANFGQRPFLFTIPTGFKTLNTTNLPNPSIKRPTDHFDVKLWSGNGTALTVGNTAKQTTTTQIPKSLRFRKSVTAYLSRTFGTPTNANKWTLSFWVKRGILATAGESGLFSAGGTSGYFEFTTGDQFQMSNGASSFVTTRAFRDPTVWNHIIVAADTSQTGYAKLRVYVNGAEETSFATDGRSLFTGAAFNNSGIVHYVGLAYNTSYTLDGYLSEYNFIDGQALTPSSFGQFDSNNNWFPKAYTGTYGTNGFYLPFNDPTSTTTIGYDRQLGLTDSSKNNWTSSGIYLTSTTNYQYDSMIDSPTDYDDGTNIHGNYATLNSAKISANITISAANTQYTVPGSVAGSVHATLPFSSGKWYAEMTIGSAPITSAFGITLESSSPATSNSIAADQYGIYGDNANGYAIKVNGSNVTGYFNGFVASGEVWGLAVDADAGTIYFYKNNAMLATSAGNYTNGDPIVTNIPKGTYTFGVAGNGATNNIVNFGQRPFTYTPPTGYKALNTKNLRDVGSYNLPDTYGKFVNNPDFVWIKNRNSTQSHETFDSLRGPSNYLPIGASGAAYVETVDANTLTEFSSNGFKLGSGSSLVNTSANTYVGWCWNAGSSTVTNNDGSLNSMVRANPTAGFSIVSFYGTGANATVGHGLGATPAMILLKARNLAYSWIAYHKGIATPETARAYLDDGTTAIATSATVYNSTAPNSSVFSLGSSVETNSSGYNYMAYCWTPIPGYSAFGSYTGNAAADGPFIYCGFRPRWIMLKVTGTTGNWVIYDTVRESTGNPLSQYLFVNTAAAEPGGSTVRVDMLSNGFKIRNTGQDNQAYNYIYAAFAETPFKYANAR